MRLFTETSGSGPDLVLIHGWGLQAGVWDTLVPLLESDFRITRVDLPGHGRSHWRGEDSLASMADAVLGSTPEHAAWLGWSLGGLIAAQAALESPPRISRLILVASSPAFIASSSTWPGMQPGLLDEFADDLQHDYVKTLNRFLALQVRGSEGAGSVLRALRTTLLAHGQPAAPALKAGLNVLRNANLLTRYPDISCPVLMIMGAHDTLVPVAAGRRAAELISGARLEIVEGAGHAPFLAQPRRVADLIRHFLLLADKHREKAGHA